MRRKFAGLGDFSFYWIALLRLDFYKTNKHAGKPCLAQQKVLIYFSLSKKDNINLKKRHKRIKYNKIKIVHNFKSPHGTHFRIIWI